MVFMHGLNTTAVSAAALPMVLWNCVSFPARLSPAGGGPGGGVAPELPRRASSCTARAAFVDVTSPMSFAIRLDRCVTEH